MDQEQLEALKKVYNSLSRGKMQPHEQRFMMGVEYEELVMTQTQNFEQPLTKGQANQLAFAYQLQGRYREAMEFASKEQADVIAKLQVALAMNDDIFCSCDAPPVEQEKVWSEKHKAFTPVLLCPQCQYQNITPSEIKPTLLKKYYAEKARALNALAKENR